MKQNKQKKAVPEIQVFILCSYQRPELEGRFYV